MGALAFQLAQDVTLEDALPLSCALASISLLAPGTVSSYSSGLYADEPHEAAGGTDPKRKHHVAQRRRAKQVRAPGLRQLLRNHRS